MQVQHLYIISFQKGSAGEHKPPKKSAKGLFFKYADRPGTDSVTWYHVGMDGEAKLRAEWKRDEPVNHEKLRNRKGGIPLLRDADVAVPARNLKQDAGGAGAYIVAHAAECQVANMSAYNLTGL